MKFRTKFHRWWRKFRKLDCPHCKTALSEYGYCSPCNHFPHRKWITGAEDLWISEVQWSRDDPEDYAEYERCSRKITVWYALKEHSLKRKFLVGCYGQELVEETETELAMIQELAEEVDLL